MERPSMLIIGGTGIIGEQTAQEALLQGYSVASVGLEKSNKLPAEIEQYAVDRNEPGALEALAKQLNAKQQWDVVVDVISFSQENVRQTLQCFKDAHTFFLSTTLVYDRKSQPKEPIPSSYPLAKRGELGGYVDHKLEVEDAIRSSRDRMKWTILRPYHVLGHGSTVGCVPSHNRDPLLSERIRTGKRLQLCDTTLCVVHPRDISKTILAAAGREATFGKAYNVVNADVPVTVEQYHRMIGEVVGREPIIEWMPLSEIWEKSQGWALTALPEHRYSVDDLQKDVGYAPHTSPKQCIEDALRHPGDTLQMHRRMNLSPAPLPYEQLFNTDRSS